MTTKNKYPDWLEEIKVIIWDLDGTLYQSDPELKEKIDREAAKLIAQAQKIDLDEAATLRDELYSKLKSMTMSLIAAGVDKDFARSGDWHTWLQLEDLKPNLELVESLRTVNFIPHIVCTNSGQEAAEKKLAKIGFELSDFQEVISAPEKMGLMKPDITVYQQLLDLTGLDPDRHLFVGDRFETDLASAKEVGMKTALVYEADDRADWRPDSAKDILEAFSLLSESK